MPCYMPLGYMPLYAMPSPCMAIRIPLLVSIDTPSGIALPGDVPQDVPVDATTPDPLFASSHLAMQPAIPNALCPAIWPLRLYGYMLYGCMVYPYYLILYPVSC